MTVLFSGNVTIATGASERGPFAIPANVKQAGVPLNVTVSMGAEQFPNGDTDITVLLSLDGGLTYPRSATMGVKMPATFRGPPPHFWSMGFSLGANDTPTHAKVDTNAPAAFTTSVTISAV